jgi:hypothetical protein
LIRRSPIHAIKEVENLVNLLRNNIQHRRDALTIAEILEDIFINVYLPENRRLVSINQQSNQPNTKQTAVLAFVEDTIKQLYSSFIDLIQVNNQDLNLSLFQFDFSSKSHMIQLVQYVLKQYQCLNVYYPNDLNKKNVYLN